MKTSAIHKHLTSGIAFAIAMLLPALAAHADPNVIVVDNDGGPHAHFTDLQEAVDAADDGDVVQVMGSPHFYGDIPVKRRVNIVGTGYNLGAVDWGDGYPDIAEARVGDITFTAGYEEVEGVEQMITAARSTVSFLRFSRANVEVPDIAITHCWANSSIVLNDVSLDETVILPERTHVLQNYIHGRVYASGSTARGATGHVIESNIIEAIGSGSQRQSGLNGAVVKNNVFTGPLDTESSSTVENNILSQGFSESGSGSLIRKNVIWINNEPTNEEFLADNDLVDNQIVEDWSTLFTETGAFDEQYQLAEGSPAIGAGYQGVDAGAFGGDTPYQISGGGPPFPRVTLLVPPPFIVSPNNELTIPVRVEVE